MPGNLVLLAALPALFPALLLETASASGICSSLAQRTAGVRSVPSPAEEPSGSQAAPLSRHSQASLANWDTATGGLGISSSTVAQDWWGQDSDSPYDLLIIVPTHGQRDLVKRQAIRDSWGRYLNKSSTQGCAICQNKTAKLLFVVGTEGGLKEMNKEADEFKDMGVLEDFGQTEYGFSGAEKTQRSIRFAVEHFKFRLLLKVESDSWVFLDRLFALLERERLWGSENSTALSIYGGHFDGPGEDHSPWAAATSDAIMNLTGSHSLPPHAAGAGYLLSPDLCEYIAGMGAPSEQVRDGSKRGKKEGLWAPYPRLASLPDEDAAVGFWLLAVNHTKVSLPVLSSKMACEEGNEAGLVTIVDHPVSTDEMYRRWRSYTELGDPCKLQVDTPARQKAQQKVTQWLRRHIAMPGDVAKAAVQRVWQHAGDKK